MEIIIFPHIFEDGHADMIVVSDKIAGFPELDRIELLDTNTWFLSGQLK